MQWNRYLFFLICFISKLEIQSPTETWKKETINGFNKTCVFSQWEGCPHMHENSNGIPWSSPVFFVLSTSVPHSGVLDWGGATQPLTNSEFCSVTGWGTENSSGPYIVGLISGWFLLHSLAAFLSTARKWPRDWALFTLSASVLFLEHNEKNHILDLLLLLLLLLFLVLQLSWSVFLPLIDLLDSSRMLVTPIRFPSVILLSWKKDPVDCIYKPSHSTLTEGYYVSNSSST